MSQSPVCGKRAPDEAGGPCIPLGTWLWCKQDTAGSSVVGSLICQCSAQPGCSLAGTRGCTSQKQGKQGWGLCGVCRQLTCGVSRPHQVHTCLVTTLMRRHALTYHQHGCSKIPIRIFGFLWDWQSLSTVPRSHYAYSHECQPRHAHVGWQRWQAIECFVASLAIPLTSNRSVAWVNGRAHSRRP